MEQEDVPSRKFPLVNTVLIIILIAVCASLGWLYLETRGPDKNAEPIPFVVTSDMTGEAVINKIESAGLIRNPWLFRTIMRSKNPLGKIPPGGYQLSKSMNMFAIADILNDDPTSVWITIPEGLRKEEISKILSDKLQWEDKSSLAFLEAYKTLGQDYYEGSYFPETYLIPIDDGGAKVAKRMMTTFNEKLATMSPDLAKQNIKWTTALRVASLVQREAGSKADMPVIAAVIWNRLAVKQRLEVDATIQYAKNTAPDWWAPLKAGDTNFESPYNTYRNYGLPPTPIANPGLDALRAAIYPADSKCLYYIHDKDKQIHCSVKFAEHKANIAKYLK